MKPRLRRSGRRGRGKKKARPPRPRFTKLPGDQAFAASFFHVRLGALVTNPFFSALAVTRM